VAKECEGQVVVGSDTVDAPLSGPGGFVEAVGAKVCELGALDVFPQTLEGGRSGA